MKRLIILPAITVLVFTLVSISLHDASFRLGREAFAVCTTEEIKNRCCYEFLETLKSEIMTDDRTTRESKAMKSYIRCLRTIHCANEMVEIKSKSFNLVRSICDK